MLLWFLLVVPTIIAKASIHVLSDSLFTALFMASPIRLCVYALFYVLKYIHIVFLVITLMHMPQQNSTNDPCHHSVANAHSSCIVKIGSVLCKIKQFVHK